MKRYRIAAGIVLLLICLVAVVGTGYAQTYPDQPLLVCSNRNLTALDLSGNTNLTELWCAENRLTDLDLSANTNLVKLVCHGNKLNELDLSVNRQLTELYCGHCGLTNLDLAANTLLFELYLNGNDLSGIDLSANTQLRGLYCKDNGRLTRLDLSVTPKLFFVDCRGCPTVEIIVADTNHLPPFMHYDGKPVIREP